MYNNRIYKMNEHGCFIDIVSHQSMFNFRNEAISCSSFGLDFKSTPYFDDEMSRIWFRNFGDVISDIISSENI